MSDQCSAQVSALALALVTGRVLLVDSALLHHLLLPPPGLAWHYSLLVGSDAGGPGLLRGDVDVLLSSAAYVDMSAQNPTALSDLLCADLAPDCADLAPGRVAPCADAALRERFLYVTTDQYLVPALLRSRASGPLLSRLLGLVPGGEGSFGLLGRYVIRPKRSIVAEVRASYARLAAAAAATAADDSGGDDGAAATGGGAEAAARRVLTVGMQVRSGPGRH